jgi:Calcineurin-like phosphoesterase
MTDLNLKPPFAMVLGDTHGSVYYTVQSIQEAHQRGVTRIIQLGDWGYLWPDTNLDDPTEAINVVSEQLLEHNITMFFIRGNHDWKRGVEGHEVWLANLGFTYMPDGWSSAVGFTVPTFFYGGAVSIDRKYRKDGLDYFEDEKPVHIDRQTLMRHDRLHSSALLFSHEAPQSPPGFEKPHSLMVGDEELISDCHRSRAKAAFVARQGWFTSIFHGHYHTSQRYKFNNSDCCDVYALNAAGSVGDSLYLDIDGQVTV